MKKVKDARPLLRDADQGRVDSINGHNPTTTTPAEIKTQAAFIVDDVVKTWETPPKYVNYAKPNQDRVRADAQVIWDETR